MPLVPVGRLLEKGAGESNPLRREYRKATGSGITPIFVNVQK